MRIIIGKSGNQCFKIGESNVSREHAEVEIDEQTGVGFLRDLNSTNGTFIRDEETGDFRRISKVNIHPLSYICLGPDNSKGCSFYVHQLLNPGNYQQEMEYIKRKDEEIDNKLEEVNKRLNYFYILVFVLNIVIVAVSCIDSISEGIRWQILRIVPLVSTGVATFFKMYDPRKVLSKKKDSFHHCPNPICHNKLRSVDIENMSCPVCKSI